MTSTVNTVSKKGKEVQKRTAIDNPNIRPKRLGREIGHVAHIVAEITHSNDPVEYRTPDRDPAHEVRVDGGLVDDHNVVNGVVEQRYQAGDSHDSQRLCTENTENHRRQCRGEERLVDSVELACASVHVESVGDGGEYAALLDDGLELVSVNLLDKVHPDCTCNCSVGQGVCNITPVVG